MRKTSYAQAKQAKSIRKKMAEIVTNESNCELKDLVRKFIPDAIALAIQKECRKIYPLQHVHIRKVKVLKTPKLDTPKLLELHGDVSTALAPVPATTTATTEETGVPVTEPTAEIIKQ